MLSYFISKFLPYLFLPLGIVLVLLFISIYRKSLWPLPLSFSILFFFSIPIISELLLRIVEYPWRPIPLTTISNVDAVVVLSDQIQTTPSSSNKYEFSDPDRFLAGINIFKNGKAKKLLFTGGYNPFRQDLITVGSFYTKKAEEYGINYNDIIITSPVSNTYEESIDTSKIIKNLSTKPNPSIILVTSAFHMSRSYSLFKMHGMTIIPYPVDFRASYSPISNILLDPLNWLPNSSSLNKSTLALRELYGRLFVLIFH